MTSADLRALAGRLAGSMNALTVVGAALAARVRGGELPAAIRQPVADVLAALEVDAAIAALTPEESRRLLAEIRLAVQHAARRLTADGHRGAWCHTEPEALEDAGDVSGGFPALLRGQLARLEGLDLGRGARFLDVGAGVAALSIAMAESWPELAVVGVDRWAPSLAIGRQRIERAGLAHRIELREQAIEDLADAGAFDLAWVPGGFLAPAALERGLPRVRRALRAGGWILLASPGLGGDRLAAALTRLRGAEWGGCTFDADQGAGLLAAAGFARVTTLLPGAPFTLMAARA